VSGIVSRYGIDPRGFSLLAFGGAGPMMACFIARENGIRHIVVPTTPGVLSALGGLIADLKNDFVHTAYVDLLPDAMPALARAVHGLRKRGEEWLRDEAHHAGPPAISVSAEMRYKGQSFEIDTPLEETWFVDGRIDAIAQAFHARHAHLYGYATPAAPVQIVALRIVVTGIAPKPDIARVAKAQADPRSSGEADVWIEGRWHRVPLYDRAALLAGARFDGPAIVTQSDCTTCVLPGFGAEIDEYGNIHLKDTSEHAP
jgi:N-methylhydantoinase A